jgi:hypothetical protein
VKKTTGMGPCPRPRPPPPAEDWHAARPIMDGTDSRDLRSTVSSSVSGGEVAAEARCPLPGFLPRRNSAALRPRRHVAIRAAAPRNRATAPPSSAPGGPAPLDARNARG